MLNVVAINAAAHQGIIAAQATSDEALLASIAEGGRTAMHILYSRHHVRVYRFILRMVRDATTAEDLTSQVFLDVWRTASQFQDGAVGEELGVVAQHRPGVLVVEFSECVVIALGGVAHDLLIVDGSA